jgi:hypothetical protein
MTDELRKDGGGKEYVQTVDGETSWKIAIWNIVFLPKCLMFVKFIIVSIHLCFH